MALIYKPIRQFMQPQNIAINPAATKDFTCQVDGSTCIAYRFSVYDLDNNKITPPSTVRVDLGSTLYDEDILTITASENTLTAGNQYKWQMDMYANDLTVSSINTTTEVLTVTNHNLNTGDIIYIQSTGTLPTGTSAFTVYYIRKISANELALYTTYEAAKSNGTKVNISGAGSGTITISNIAISEQIPFTVYNVPTLTLTPTTITEQSYEFVPTYSQSQNVLINKFTAYLYDVNNVELKNSGEIYSANIRYSFDGLISDKTYGVRFIAIDQQGQTIDTGIISFVVSYSQPNIMIKPTAINNYNTSSILVELSNIVQITGTVTGVSSYLTDWVSAGNSALQLNASAILEYTGLNIQNENTLTRLWYPLNITFTGDILKVENTTTGTYIIVGYDNSIDCFYRNINGVRINNSTKTLVANKIYLLALTNQNLYTIDFYTL